MPEQPNEHDQGPWPPPTPTVADAIEEVRKVLQDADTTEPQHMDHSLYIRAYDDLDINVRVLLDALEATGIGNSPTAQTPGKTADRPPSAVELVGELRRLLGIKLVAYLGFTDVRTVVRWADPTDPVTPPDDAAARLLFAHQAAAVIHQKDSVAVVQAWFQGCSSILDGISPARFLRNGELADVGPKVLDAARDFAAGS